MINFFTSIAPFHVKKQFDAIKTWTDLGFNVHSVNTEGEIKSLSGEFPLVSFHKTVRDGSELYGKPYIFINDIFNIATKLLRSDDVFVLCNSDIVIDQHFYNENIFKIQSGQLTLATRFNISDREAIIGLDYDCGIDVFIAKVSSLGRLDMMNFCLGVPFWDFWLPLQALIKSFSVRKIQFPLALHVTHPENYSHQNLQKSGVEFLSGLANIHPPFFALWNRLIQAEGTKAFDEVLVNEVIFPTIAVLQRNIEFIGYINDTDIDSCAEARWRNYCRHKHSDSLPMIPLIRRIFDLICLDAMTPTTAVEMLASEGFVKDSAYFPLYSHFYSRFSHCFQVLTVEDRMKKLSLGLLPVYDSCLAFSSLDKL